MRNIIMTALPRITLVGLFVAIVNLYAMANDQSESAQTGAYDISGGGDTRNGSATTDGAASTIWVSAYYDVWQMNPVGSSWWSEPPDRLDYTNGITHIIQFP